MQDFKLQLQNVPIKAVNNLVLSAYLDLLEKNIENGFH